MLVLYEKKQISQKLKNIDFIDDGKFLIMKIYLSVHTYIFELFNKCTCCEQTYMTIEDYETLSELDEEDIEETKDIVSKFLNKEVNEIIVKEIPIIDNTFTIRMVIYFDDEEKSTLSLSMNNQHDGYYPHSVTLELENENENENGNELLFKTYI